MSSLTHSPLRRFVTDGLRDTIDSYTAGTLPLHRFTWELHTRLDALTELTALPHYRTLNTLRGAHRTIATIDVQQRTATRQHLSAADQHTLAAAITTLRTTLARLDPDDPIDPVDPTQPRPAVLTPRPRAATRRTTDTRHALIA
jgi:hypothetical protein